MTVYIPVPQTAYQRDASQTSKRLSPQVRQMLILLGIPIDNLTMDETIGRIEEFVRIGRATGKTHQVATVNTDFLVKSLEDAALRDLLQHIDLCTADGMPLVWGSRLLGVPLKERVAGSDLVPLLAQRAAENGTTLYFMGSGTGVAAQAAATLENRYPGLRVVGTSSPYWNPDKPFDPAILTEIKTLKPDILLVALGNPKQELWIKQYGAEVGVPVAIGIGASLDFIVGVTKRAPVWMQNTGLEWVARLVQEPGRLWKRYLLGLTKFGPSLLKQWWLMCRKEQFSAEPFRIDVRAIGDTTILNLRGDLSLQRSQKLLKSGQRALARRHHLTVNLADVATIDCSAIGTLMELYKQTHNRGGEMRVVGLTASLGQIFEMLNVSNFFNIDEASLVHGWQG